MVTGYEAVPWVALRYLGWSRNVGRWAGICITPDDLRTCLDAPWTVSVSTVTLSGPKPGQSGERSDGQFRLHVLPSESVCTSSTYHTRGASGVCLDHCRKSVEAFCAEDPIPRLSDSLTCRQASCTHVSVFGGWERAGAAAPTPSAAPLGCFVQTVAARSEHAGEEVGNSTCPLLRSCCLSHGFCFAFKTPELSLHSCYFSHSLSVHVCSSSCCLFGPSVCRSIQYAGECRWAPVSGETIIARTGGVPPVCWDRRT